jgi:hypothetical protein
MSRSPDYLEGAVDLHVHSASDIDAAASMISNSRAAKDTRVGALLIKSHQNSTVQRAWLVSQCVPGIRVYGAVAKSDCILGTGQLSADETSVVFDAASNLGSKKILVTHPEWGPTNHSHEARNALAKRGDDFFERCFVSTTHLGQPDTPPPSKRLRLYAERLRGTGFSADQIRAMMQTNPERLLARCTPA